MPRACPEPSRRGGRRPGAGAPKGNTNGLKHGLYSHRVRLATLMLAASPELRALLTANRRASAAGRTSLKASFAWATRTVLANPDLAESIREIVARHLENALSQIQAQDPDAQNFQINQAIKDLAALR